jgi:Family of unknown function (DUF6067)
MGDEILMSGKGGGHPWGEEHLGGNYWQAWYEPGVQDVSFLTQPVSRFHNYYIEGLRWLCENAGCDGIYLDDIAYDRSIMLRARKVLDRYCPRGGLIDLHSWNEFRSRRHCCAPAKCLTMRRRGTTASRAPPASTASSGCAFTGPLVPDDAQTGGLRPLSFMHKSPGLCGSTRGTRLEASRNGLEARAPQSVRFCARFLVRMGRGARASSPYRPASQPDAVARALTYPTCL